MAETITRIGTNEVSDQLEDVLECPLGESGELNCNHEEDTEIFPPLDKEGESQELQTSLSDGALDDFNESTPPSTRREYESP